MKKVVILVMCFSILFMPFAVYASNTYVINSKASTSKSCSIKTKPNEQGDYIEPGITHWLDPGDVVTLIDGESPVKSTNSACSSSYYPVLFKGLKGYVCGDFINFDTNGKFDEEFKNAGFPSSYWLSLNSLKERHPNWKFTAYITNVDWQTAINAESAVEYNSSSNTYWSRSYIHSTNPRYLSKAEGSYNSATGTYNAMETGEWYAANADTVAYYMDPRNFLNDRDIFMFESAYANQSRQSKEVISALFSKTAHSPYVDDFYDAATAGGNNISSVMLGTRSRLEVGGSKLSNAANGSRGYYNFYNIGSLSSCSNPVACGNNFAQGKGWTTARTAIIGGASFIYNSYVQKEQKTIYFQKFNTTLNGNLYAHQYMTNIEAPKNEASMMYQAYVDANKLNDYTEFFIPVYNNMPNESNDLPNTEEKAPSEDKTPTYDDIPTVIARSGYIISGNYLRNISNGTTTEQISSNLKSKGNVTVSIANKSISATQNLVTGDTITINNGSRAISYQIAINGDTNGDGKVTASDYVKVKNHIMGTGLQGVYQLAADANGDGKISASDYVKIKNYIMGSGSI